MVAVLWGLLLRVGTLQALTLRGPPTLRGGPSFATSAASRSRLSPAQAVAESSVVVELEARLNRWLSTSEIIFAHETVSVVRDLAQAQHAAKRMECILLSFPSNASRMM